MSGLRPDQLPLDPLTLQVIAGTLSVVGGPGGGGSTRVQYFVTDGPATVGGLPYVDLAEVPASKESVQVQVYGGSPQLNEELTSALSLNADFAITVSNSMEENRLTWEAPLEMGDVLVSAGMVIMVSYSVGSSSSPPSPPPPSSASIPKVEYFVTDGVGTVDAVKYLDLTETPSDPSAIKVIVVGGSYQLNAELATPGSYEITLDVNSNLRRINWDGFTMESALTEPGIYIAVEYYINQATTTIASDITTTAFTGLLSGSTDVQEALNATDNLTALSLPVSGLPAPLDIAPNVADALALAATAIEDLQSNPFSDPSKVNVDGDTMTGPLVLSGAPTANLHAATKQYADSKVRDQIQNGVTSSAPSENAVFDALALKQDAPSAGFKIQSGKINTGSSNPDNTVYVTFPEAFATAPVVILTLESMDRHTTEVRLHSTSATGFTATAYNIGYSGGSIPFPLHWIAVGV